MPPATANALVRMLLAPGCAACRRVLTRPLDAPVCEACRMAIPHLAPPWCLRCGDALPPGAAGVCGRCRLTPRLFSAARSAGLYEGSLRALIHAFKFQRRRSLGPWLAALAQPAAVDVLTGADAVVPVPLHPWRSLARGFNQADDLACGLGLPVWRLLRRQKLGRSQSRLPANHRSDNVRHTFTLARRGRAAALEDRVLVVVDDVMTTGETADACSRVLLEAGAREVRVVTVARAVAGRQPVSPRPPLPSMPRRQ